MSVISNKTKNADILNILDFWHKCEFFLPYDLQRNVLDVKQEERWPPKSLSLADLSQDNSSLWNFTPPIDKEIVGFDLYIGIFDTAEITARVEKILGVTQGLEATEEDELRKLEGPTCMARIAVNANGVPAFSSLSISTVSWALGSCRENLNLEHLDIDSFKNDVRQLKLDLLEFNYGIPATESSDQPNGLTGPDLFRLLELFVAWSKEWPGPVDQAFSKGPALVIKAKTKKPRKQAQSENRDAGSQTDLAENDEAEDDEADQSQPSDADIDILNSFYARDIARAIQSVRQGTTAGLVSAYLSEPDLQKRIDLYTTAGLQRIMEGLEPSKLPSAHWPSDPKHAMSLMQQFALNTLLGNLQNGDIFSFNGPPGTGKTTLLRDIFAELMTRRARTLSRLTRAKDAFQHNINIEFDNGPIIRSFNTLQEDITGYEMVVVSSNNAAVENLSKDLPKASALGDYWKENDTDTSVSYLQPVAYNIASRRSDGKYDKLAADDQPWGLFAAALGRSQNRRHFQFGLGYDGTPTGKSHNSHFPPNYDPDLQQSIWNWRNKHKSISFETAKQTFIAADMAVEKLISALEDYKELLASGATLSEKDFCASFQSALDTAIQTHKQASDEVSALKTSLDKTEAQLDLLVQRENLTQASSPRGFFEKLFKNEQKKKCDETLIEIRTLKEK